MRPVRTFSAALAVASLMAVPSIATAVGVASFAPQGEVARVRQAVVRFDGPVIAFGDAKAPAPFSLSCDDAAAGKGNGRWTSDREWIWEFADDLPPGVRCSVFPVSGFKSPISPGEIRLSSYQFNSGGPFVQRIWPGVGTRIDETQFFAMRLNGAADPATMLAHVWCSVEGLGERVPIRALDASERPPYFKALGVDEAAAKDPMRYPAFACNRRLAASAKVQIVYGKGVAMPVRPDGLPGIANTVERRYAYTVREPFTASFTCERENAQAACLPIRAMTLAFNAPVERKAAEAIRLTGGRDGLKPAFDKEDDTEGATVNQVTWKPPFAERTPYAIEIPKDFKDASGRALSNAASFPLKSATGPMPPLARFAASPFGIVERYAEPGGAALLPVTLRRVEPVLKIAGVSPGRVSDVSPSTDPEIIDWWKRLRRYERDSVPRVAAARDASGPVPPPLGRDDREYVQTRMVPLVTGRAGAAPLDLPKPAAGDERPFEVVGIPLKPGFHVLEIASPALGRSLLDPKLGEARTMYVRTSALVTNLSVHVKLGRENAMAWVTTLDKGRTVADAVVRVSSCDGKEVAVARTDAQGRAVLPGLAPEAPACGADDEEDGDGSGAWFVSARTDQDGGDMAFAWSDWQRGIESWRFNVPTSRESEPDRRAHTILDRALFRAGETVSMKHLLRDETRAGFSAPDPKAGPATMVITHTGSGQEWTQALAWRRTATGGLSAESRFAVPPAAKLGAYEIALKGATNDASFASGRFRVEEFRLPVLEGRIAPLAKAPLVRPAAVPASLQINYVAGGGASGLAVRVSASVRAKRPDFGDYGGFAFEPPRPAAAGPQGGGEERAPGADTRIVADKLAVTLDRSGAGTVTIPDLPAAETLRDLVIEATYADPSGEVQTLRSTSAVWPAAVVAGIKTEGWVSSRGTMRFQALALSTDGKPAAGTPLEVRAISRTVTTTRKRMVGGFYTYDNKSEAKDLGVVCAGKADARGLLLCETKPGEAGEIELVATAKDAQGHASRAAGSIFVTRQGELWFGGEDHDRMDLLPEKKAYEPGETARFQVRMPFRFATALVAVEREGIVETEVVELRGDDPTVQIKVKDSWGPNVYVSVLALRGRLRDVPWYSLFTWGWRAPRDWWSAYRNEGRDWTAPTAMVDLSKPAFRFGMAEIRVGTRAHAIAVTVTPDKPAYPVRGQSVVTVSARLPGGAPAAGAEIAFAAVDQALLELMPNPSWDLLESMMRRRSWGVVTATAQMEVIGRRHYGRKAVPAGGGGGKSPTRELLDTLLLWNPRVVLDANGEAKLTVPLNDALTAFKLVAVADSGTGLFGTGQATIRATQDLQIASGLPPLVREGDTFRAQFTLRNTTAQPMSVEFAPRASLLELATRTVDIPANEAREVAFDTVAPVPLGLLRSEALLWEVAARDIRGTARDALKVTQRVLPAVPVAVQQATLAQIDGPYTLEVAPPPEALANQGVPRGGLKLSLQPRLGEGLPGVRDWFASYPYSCLEQQASKAIGMRDPQRWRVVAANLPTYLDVDGLAGYFPPRSGEGDRGSDTLTAYLLAATHEAGGIDRAYAIPDESRARMEAGLVAFIEGRIKRDFWSPQKDLDVRKLAALEALSRFGKAQGRMLASITVTPNQWPTGAVIDWLQILRRVADAPQRDARIAEALQVLKGRISYQGTKLLLGTDQTENWWWLMTNGDVNTARLLLAVIDDPAWKDDMGRLAAGFIGRQQRGAWHTTTANLWGGLALEKFSAKFEREPVTGVTKAQLADASATIDWSRVTAARASDPSGAKGDTKSSGTPVAADNLRGNTASLAWPKGGTKDTLLITHAGGGRPWLTLQSLAAVELKAPFSAGYAVKKTVTPVEQAVAGSWSRGDVMRIALEINASTDMTWVVASDPIPGGATILGGGLGRDSQIATQGEKRPSGAAWPAFEERSFEAYRSYYEFMPKGVTKIEYTVRLNNAGDFAVPPTRVEAMYAPEMFGESPNPKLKVGMK